MIVDGCLSSQDIHSINDLAGPYWLGPALILNNSLDRDLPSSGWSQRPRNNSIQNIGKLLEKGFVKTQRRF